MHALEPLSPCLMPMWPSTLLGSVRKSHIGLTMLASSRPNAGNSPRASAKSGKKSVLVLVVAAPRADIDAGAIAVVGGGVRRERVAMGDEAGVRDRASRGVEPEQIGAADELVQLAIVDQRARIEIGDLRREAAGPVRGVPLRDGADGRAAGQHGVENRFRRHSCRAHRTGAGHDHARRLRHG